MFSRRFCPGWLKALFEPKAPCGQIGFNISQSDTNVSVCPRCLRQCFYNISSDTFSLVAFRYHKKPDKSSSAIRVSVNQIHDSNKKITVKNTDKTFVCRFFCRGQNGQIFFYRFAAWARRTMLKVFCIFQYKSKMSGTSVSVSFRALYGVKMFSKFIMCLSRSCALGAVQKTALRVRRPSGYGGIGTTASASS